MKTYLLISFTILLTFCLLTKAQDENLHLNNEEEYLGTDCFVGGCHGQICTDNRTIWTTCDWADEFSCYVNATCERREDGKCGWRTTPELSKCLEVIDRSAEPCYTGGCFNQICANTPYASSSCNWVDKYGCYSDAKCERQSNGKCNWSSTSSLRQCIKKATPSPAPCYVSGCFNQICSWDPNVWSLCDWKDEFACYRDGKCERQSNGECGWTVTAEMEKCFSGPDPQACYVGGCSSELCTDDPSARSSCDYQESYNCYRDATCKRQSNGKCGWTNTPELEQCLGNNQPEGELATCYVTGCSSELCTDDPSTQSDCNWKEWYGCYTNATCARQGDGKCAWTSTPDLQQCLGGSQSYSDSCYIGGCSSELCTDKPNAQSSCDWKEWYSCYKDATCERQTNGECGWTMTSYLDNCVGGYQTTETETETETQTVKCYVGGCSSELCTSDANAQSSCEWKEWYSCYKDATCEVQQNGECGWTMSSYLSDCIGGYQNTETETETETETVKCYIGGCSSELCTSDANAQSSCEWKEWYSCYKDATCEVQQNGECGWTMSSYLSDCIGGYQNTETETETETETVKCYVGGCSSELCTNDANAQSSCEWKEWYSCYKDATCEVQQNGECGWTMSSYLSDCIGGYQTTETETETETETVKCYVGGCSSELCTNNPNAQSSCDWKEWYSCYKDATCEVQVNGDCGWTTTTQLSDCLGGYSSYGSSCYVGGCSSELCTDNPSAQSSCDYREWYSCYKDAKCERQSSGECGWTTTSDLEYCIGGYQNTETETETSTCYVGGCSSELCTNNPNAQSDCSWKEWYSCYKDATCEVQGNGDCGWTTTTQLSDCLGGYNSYGSSCYVGGCSSELCTGAPNASSSCEWKEWYSCYKDATCERQSSGECGWSMTSYLNDCIGGYQTTETETETETVKCYVGGCSSELCTSDANAQSSCDWKEWYSCYKDATCEVQDNGDCGWTTTTQLSDCLGGYNSYGSSCYVGGCSSELCTDNPNAQSSCDWKEWYSCYKDAKCERQNSGECGWTLSSTLNDCLGGYQTSSDSKPCYIGGCSSELCTDKANAQSSCLWKEYYSCYKDATCERQANGNCNWTQTSDLTQCLGSYQS